MFQVINLSSGVMCNIRSSGSTVHDIVRLCIFSTDKMTCDYLKFSKPLHLILFKWTVNEIHVIDCKQNQSFCKLFTYRERDKMLSFLSLRVCHDTKICDCHVRYSSTCTPSRLAYSNNHNFQSSKISKLHNVNITLKLFLFRLLLLLHISIYVL